MHNVPVNVRLRSEQIFEGTEAEALWIADSMLSDSSSANRDTCTSPSSPPVQINSGDTTPSCKITL